MGSWVMAYMCPELCSSGHMEEELKGRSDWRQGDQLGG